MSELPVRGIRIIKDTKVDTSQSSIQQLLPVINSGSFPPNSIPGTGSAIAYDGISKRIYYNTGTAWIALANSGSSTGGVFSYAFIKDAAQVIVPSTPTIVTDWTLTPSPPNHDNTGDWNLTTGVYTADAPQTLSLNVDLSWMAGVSNQGDRTVQIIYQPFAGSPIVAREVTTQGEPDMNVNTPQETSTFLQMSIGDQAWITVSHTAPVNLILDAGNRNGISGIRVNPM